MPFAYFEGEKAEEENANGRQTNNAKQVLVSGDQLTRRRTVRCWMVRLLFCYEWHNDDRC